MSEDRYPMEYLIKRLFDVVLFIIAVSCLLIAVTIGMCVENFEQQLVIGLGMTASSIAALLDYRQKTAYETDPVELCLLSNSLQVKYLNTIAKLRHKLVATNILIIVFGMWVSGYGAVWKAS